MVRKTLEYSTMTFSDIYEDVEDFLADYHDNGLTCKITDQSASTLFYLLYARYGNNPIANYDINQFRMKLFSIVFQYGPAWEKRLDVQDKIRNLNEDEIRLGYKSISNHGFNPSTEPSTDTLDELQYINDQNVNKGVSGKLDAYGRLLDMIASDVTEPFIDKFKVLFKLVVRDEYALTYITDEQEENVELV